MIIDTNPPSLRALFIPFRGQLTRPQFRHLCTTILAWIVNVGRSDVLHLAQCSPRHGYRTSKGRFLTAAPLT